VPHRDDIMIALTLYSRPGCHLCDDMKAIIHRAAAEAGVAIALDEIDISTDPNLELKYGEQIPVLLVNGKKAAKYRVSQVELRRLLTDRAEER
jgi:glutaredoxin